MPRIYADNAATTKISQTAMKAMISAMENSYGNPSVFIRLGWQQMMPYRRRESRSHAHDCMPKIFYIRWDKNQIIRQLCQSGYAWGETE